MSQRRNGPRLERASRGRFHSLKALRRRNRYDPNRPDYRAVHDPRSPLTALLPK